MRYAIWFLPAEVAPQVAILLIMLCGFAVMFRQKALAVSLFVSALVLLCMPLFEPVIDVGVDTAIDTGWTVLQQTSWWVITGIFIVTLFLLLRVILIFLFGRGAADVAVGTLLADGIRLVLRLLVLGPVRLVIAVFRFLRP